MQLEIVLFVETSRASAAVPPSEEKWDKKMHACKSALWDVLRW